MEAVGARRHSTACGIGRHVTSLQGIKRISPMDGVTTRTEFVKVLLVQHKHKNT